METVALAFAVLEFGGATDLGIVLLAREIPIVMFLLLGGVYADRLPRRTILVGCDLAKGAAQAVTAVLLFSGTATVWNVALLQTVFGIAAAFSRPATIGIVKEAVIALNPIGYALIGPIAAAIGTSETLAIAEVLYIAVCIGIVLVPSIRRLRNDTSPVAAMTELAP